jgi:hypothetical protein
MSEKKKAAEEKQIKASAKPQKRAAENSEKQKKQAPAIDPTMPAQSATAPQPARRPSHADVLAMIGAGQDPAGIMAADSRLVAMVRDPVWLYAYWEVGAQAMASLRGILGQDTVRHARWVIRLHDGGHMRETNVHAHQRCCYLSVEPGRNYRICVGVVSPSGDFHEIASSEVVQTPAAGLSDHSDPEWPVVEQTWGHVAEALGARGTEGWMDFGASRFGQIDRESLQFPRFPAFFSKMLHVAGSSSALHRPITPVPGA